MNLLEYIKMSYLRPNRQVLKGLGASDDLVAYLMETSGNTNIVIANQLIGSGSDETDEGLVIINGTPAATYQSGGNHTSIGFLFESEPTTLANIEVGTTFTVEINNQSYDFTIAVVNTESGNRRYASAQSTAAPFFCLADTIEGFACEMFVEGDVRPITHFKVIQTSDYEESETDSSVILDDIITLVETPTAGIYATLINTSFTYEDFTNVPETIIAEIGGQTLELPHVTTNFGVAYGEMEDDWGSFNTYPIWVWINEDGSGEIGSNIYSGEQHIKLMFSEA